MVVLVNKKFGVGWAQQAQLDLGAQRTQAGLGSSLPLSSAPLAV